jgi:hypothetical protein
MVEGHPIGTGGITGKRVLKHYRKEVCGKQTDLNSITMRLPTDATLGFMYLFPFFLSLPYMFRALISPSSGVSQTVFLYTTIWFM